MFASPVPADAALIEHTYLHVYVLIV